VHSRGKAIAGDMIKVFELFNGFDIAAPDKCFLKSSSGVRGHTLKLYKCSFRILKKAIILSLMKLLMIGIIYLNT